MGTYDHKKWSVPIALVCPYIIDFVGGEEGRLEVLAEKSDVSYDLIQKLYSGKLSDNGVAREGITFEAADAILCSMGIVMEQQPELREIFWGAPLTAKVRVKPSVRCARRGCSNRFKHSKYGAKRRRYCSDKCRTIDGQHLSGKHTIRDKECRNGHLRTEENTAIDKNGRRSCRVCRNQRARERYHKANPDARIYGPYAGRSCETEVWLDGVAA